MTVMWSIVSFDALVRMVYFQLNKKNICQHTVAEDMCSEIKGLIIGYVLMLYVRGYK
jgi:hypothetical protein